MGGSSLFVGSTRSPVKPLRCVGGTPGLLVGVEAVKHTKISPSNTDGGERDDSSQVRHVQRHPYSTIRKNSNTDVTFLRAGMPAETETRGHGWPAMDGDGATQTPLKGRLREAGCRACWAWMPTLTTQTAHRGRRCLGDGNRRCRHCDLADTMARSGADAIDARMPCCRSPRRQQGTRARTTTTSKYKGGPASSHALSEQTAAWMAAFEQYNGTDLPFHHVSNRCPAGQGW